LNTIDLIFRNGIDWKAFVAAFKQLQVENEGTELTIQSIENKGDGVLVVKVSVPPDANKEHLHKHFTQSYELMAARLEDKDKQIAFLEVAVLQLATKPVSIEVKATAESNSTGNQSSNLNVGRDADGSTLNIGNIEGTVTNTNNEQLESLEAVEERYQAELKAKDERIETYRQEIDFLRELNVKLAKNPIVINSSQDNKPE
jgi:CO/xanthine dehydrogenase FAD-binding subunit